MDKQQKNSRDQQHFFNQQKLILSNLEKQNQKAKSIQNQAKEYSIPNVRSPYLFSFQTSHIMIMYFLVQGLAVCNNMDILGKQQMIKYIKTLQLSKGGFTSSSLYTEYKNDHDFNLPHIVFTYSAVNILKNLNALNKIDKTKCLQSVRRCLKSNGSFSNFQNSNEADLRFIYAALAIFNAFQSVSQITNQQKTTIKQYIDSCYNYDGGYGLRPYCQSHSGAIYCAIASYQILGYNLPNYEQTLQFLVNRQTQNESNPLLAGVQGRIGKLPDSCYTFWVGASIKIMTGKNLLNQNIEHFLKLCYNEETLSFSKYPNNAKGDPLHTLHSIVGLKILRKQDQSINIVQGTTNNSH